MWRLTQVLENLVSTAASLGTCPNPIPQGRMSKDSSTRTYVFATYFNLEDVMLALHNSDKAYQYISLL
jgi:hypothetical protein